MVVRAETNPFVAEAGQELGGRNRARRPDEGGGPANPLLNGARPVLAEAASGLDCPCQLKDTASLRA